MPSTTPDIIQSSLYRKQGIDNQYNITSGQYILPLAIDQATLSNSDSPVIVVTAHAPYRMRTVLFDYEKQGGPPQIPSPESTGAFVFLDSTIYFEGARLDSNLRTHTWEVKGVHTFCENIKSNLTDGFVLGDTTIFTTIQSTLLDNYGQGATPSSGAISFAGVNALAGWREADLVVNFDSVDGFTYFNTSYFPGQFLNSIMINGNNYITS